MLTRTFLGHFSRSQRINLLKMATSLEQLRASGTVVVADTGDFESKRPVHPRHNGSPTQPVKTAGGGELGAMESSPAGDLFL